jgi:VanZ family protein
MSVSSAQPQPRRSVAVRLAVNRFGPRRCAGWLLLYALIVVYASIVPGPLGFHFVPRDPQAVWHAFLATPFFDNGSDQRPDWIANLLMMAPLGLLATGALGTGRHLAARVIGTAFALLLGLGFVLAVKYAQMYFPPRTVSLNYIIAQSIGVALGVALLHPLRAAAPRIAAATDAASRMRLLLDAAILGFVAFALFPYDVTLSVHDIAHRFAVSPTTLLALPNADRPVGLQVVLLVATAIVAMPLGMRLLLRVERPKGSPTGNLPNARSPAGERPLGERPALAQIAATGAALLAILFGATLFVLSARVSILTFCLRLLGVVSGAMLLRWLADQDLPRARYRLGRMLPILVPLYLLLLVYANGLLTHAWMTPEQALANLNPRGLLPLWQDYIVSKDQALKSEVVHVAMYAPIGVMIWLRRGGDRRTALAAATLAGLASLAIEVGRWLKPGFQPDFNEVLVGAFAAYVANRVMPLLWPILLSIPAMVQRDPSPAARAANRSSMQRAASAAPADHVPRPTGATKLPVAAWLPLRLVLAIPLLVVAAALAWAYPLGSWQAPVALTVWVALLWRWPMLWFVLLPAILPSLDLGPWTGWIAISEADIAVLATLAVLLLRAPPSRRDLWRDDRTWLFPRLVLALATVAWLIGMLRGFSMTADFPGGSDNPYLTWLNTVRLAKPFLCALALLPFMRARQREHGDAALLFSVGMLVGLALVGLAALAERTAFTSLADIHSDFRVTATFSSMHLGGGHIGAYLAFAMPFMIVCLLRPRLWTVVSLILLLPLSGYALAVTFARTAYVAAFGSMMTTGFAWIIALRRRRNKLDWLGGALIAGAVAMALIAGLNTGFMRSRLLTILPDLATREGNWDAGLGLRDRGLAPFLLGMGTGSYPRLAALRSPPDQQPGTYVVRHDGGETYLATMFGFKFYFGQKVPVAHDTTYTVMFDMRAPVPGSSLAVSLCSKLLLYSADCHDLRVVANQSEVWQHVAAPLLSPIPRGRLPAPVELSFATGPGEVLDLAHVQLVGSDGRNVVVNGDFADGTARWFFTSDNHLVWRMKDVYLATWFDGGVLGASALLLLFATALAGAANAIRRGDPMGAPIVGALLAIFLCGVFDNVFEAPRVALLFDLAAMLGLMLGWPPPTVAPPHAHTSPRDGVSEPRSPRIIHV